MQLNKTAAKIVFGNPKFANLIREKKDITNLHWGLDETTTNALLHVAEVYKRFPHLVTPYLAYKGQKESTSMNDLALLAKAEGIIQLHIQITEKIKKIESALFEVRLERAGRLIASLKELVLSVRIDGLLQGYGEKITELQEMFDHYLILEKEQGNLFEQLLSNPLIGYIDFSIVPGQGQRLIILLHGHPISSHCGFGEKKSDLDKWMNHLTANGFGSSIIIHGGYYFYDFDMFLLKKRMIDVYIHDTGSHHVSNMSEQLSRTTVINAEDRTYMFSIIHNTEATEVNHVLYGGEILKLKKMQTA